MIEGIIIFWFVLTGLSLAYITYDLIYVTPEAPIMKWAWWLVTLYTGPVGLFFYLLSCKEPMPHTHEEFVSPLWKQALGSMVHCLAGDVTGILLSAIILGFFHVSIPIEITIEYLAGFAFGLFIFQSLFMRKIMGQGYKEALVTSFYPEFTSMNMIMAAMIPVMVIWNLFEPKAKDPFQIYFWGKMSLATIVASITAYRINYWLVKAGLKHGMMTNRKKETQPSPHVAMEHKMDVHAPPQVDRKEMATKLILTLCALTLGILISIIARLLWHRSA